MVRSSNSGRRTHRPPTGVGLRGVRAAALLAVAVLPGCDRPPVVRLDAGALDSGSPPADVGPGEEPLPVCVPSRRGVESCDGLDNDCNGVVDDVSPEVLARDPFNCGTCNNRCDLRNAVADCMGGVCVVLRCEEGFSDLDRDPANGCEEPCVPSNGGVEVCDGIDNDCDHLVDEDIDVLHDVRNCGACNAPCRLPNVAEHRCDRGVCFPVTCVEGFYDVNGRPDDGCEYACERLVAPGEPELCNGMDDDCDGATDEDLGPPNVACNPFGVCAGTEPVCEGVGGWVCHYPEAHYTPLQDACDGLDNDCDGQVDEDFPQKGEVCFAGHGVCQGMGHWVCTDDGRALRCTGHANPELATPETCDGMDQDCDGVVDNDPVDLAFVQVGNFRIYAFEASRPDATGDHAGNLAGRACSRPGVLPWTEVTYEEAVLACAMGGWRLCREDEWRMACSGPADLVYPYGNDYRPRVCNDAAGGEGGLLPTGWKDQCRSGFGVFDLSGNAKEWIAGGPPAEGGVHFLLGGAYDNDVPRSLSCRGDPIPRGGGFRFPNVGFRCCWP